MWVCGISKAVKKSKSKANWALWVFCISLRKLLRSSEIRMWEIKTEIISGRLRSTRDHRWAWFLWISWNSCGFPGTLVDFWTLVDFLEPLWISWILVDFLYSCGIPGFLWISWFLVDFLDSCGFPGFLWISWLAIYCYCLPEGSERWTTLCSFQWIQERGSFSHLLKEKKSSNPDRGRPSCGKPCAEDSLNKAIRQERLEILYWIVDRYR